MGRSSRSRIGYMSQHPFRLRQFRSKKAMDDARVSLDPASPRHVAIIMEGNGRWANARGLPRSEEHTSELMSLMRISYAVFCLKHHRTQTPNTTNSIRLMLVHS